MAPEALVLGFLLWGPNCGEPTVRFIREMMDSRCCPHLPFRISPQVRLVLGQEELRLQTPAEMLLSDSIPHTMVLTVSEGWATLSVDGFLNASSAVLGAP